MEYRTADDPGKTIVLFHFHAHVDLCRSRIGLLAALNPGMQLFGLWGGDADDLHEARTLTSCGVTHVHPIPASVSLQSRWKDTDLAVVDWYRHVGRSLSFARVHVVQWDLLFFAALQRLYPAMSDRAVALSGLVPLDRISDFWDWTVHPPLARESNRLLEFVAERFGYDGVPHACVGPGYSLSRDFLEAYSDVEPTDLGHDELRLPLFAQILGFELVDTGFYPRWRDVEIERLFNTNPDEIDPACIEAELKRESGLRAFHPCRERFDADTIGRLLQRTHQQ